MKPSMKSTNLNKIGSRTIIVWSLALVLILGSCVGFIIKDYGFVARDDKKVRKDGKAVFISENTPSISQGYRPEISDGPSIKIVTGHHGIDILGKKGTPVISCAAGIVYDAFFDIFYGHRVVIEHGQDERGLPVRSKYFHLQKRLVKKGDKIDRGQQIGTLGRTGLLAGFPHLHFEIRIGDSPGLSIIDSVNPHRFWVDGIGVITCYDSTRQWSDIPFRTTYPVPCREVDWQ
jgi:murein DD-endopeptidase MepM/ murein hydrolase activator NlpD